MKKQTGWSILCAICVSGAAEASDEPPSRVLDAPVADMALIAAADYREASALAAEGGSPIGIALSIVGDFEGTTQQFVQVNKGGEVPSASEVTVIRDGLLDDSVRAQRWDIALERTSTGGWTIREVRQAWFCRRGEQQQFATTPCP